MADYNEAPGAAFDYSKLIGGLSGQAANLRARIFDGPTDTTAPGFPVAGFVESGTTALFSVSLTAPVVGGEYVITITNAAGTTVYGADTLLVTSSAPSAAAGTDLCSLAQVKAYLTRDDTDFDSILAEKITEASALIERTAEREFADKGTLTRRVRANGSLVDLAPYDLRSTAPTITLDPNGSPTVLTASQYRLLPIGGAAQMATFYQLRLGSSVSLASTTVSEFGHAELSIAGQWGPAATPLPIVHGCVVAVGLWFRREIGARARANPDYDVDAADLRPLSLPGATLRILELFSRMVVG